MAVPVLLPAIVKALGSGGVKSAFNALTGAGAGTKRRRKKRLTNSDMLELTNIKSILGKTAAANALPFYLGRR